MPSTFFVSFPASPFHCLLPHYPKLDPSWERGLSERASSLDTLMPNYFARRTAGAPNSAPPPSAWVWLVAVGPAAAEEEEHRWKARVCHRDGGSVVSVVVDEIWTYGVLSLRGSGQFEL